MLDVASVKDVIRPFAERAVAPARVQEVRVEPVADIDGEDALDVLIVADRVPSAGVNERTDAAVRALHALQARGESRHAYIRFVEPAWLVAEPEGE